MVKLNQLLNASRTHIQSSIHDDVFPPQMLTAGLHSLDHKELQKEFFPLTTSGSHAGLVAAIRAGEQTGDPLVKSLAETWECMNWVTNPNYEGLPEMEHYLKNAAYCEIAGSRGLVVRKDVSIGFFYIGPNVHYPAHDHPSPEAYWVLTGNAEWWREGSDWQVQPPGTRIYHAPSVPHAMRTRDEPLLAFFIWTGEVASLAQVVTETQPGIVSLT